MIFGKVFDVLPTLRRGIAALSEIIAPPTSFGECILVAFDSYKGFILSKM
jgi:hypothetical protein